MLYLLRHFIKHAITKHSPDSQTFRKISARNVSEFFTGSGRVVQPKDAYHHHFDTLKLPDGKILATYVWIDHSGIIMRSKDRVLSKIPGDLSEVPLWSFDGVSCGFSNPNEPLLVPAALYRDPFRKCPHIIVLCETYFGDEPTPTNHRSHCAKVLDKISDQDPWFGIEQEYVILGSDNWPYGWPNKGYPVDAPSKYSYCGVGPHVAGREIAECHLRACIYAGLDYSGSNAEVMKSSWEFQVGTTNGIKASDDLWVGRYILHRVAENFGAVITFNPKPVGPNQPGIGCHHNFSVKKMRSDKGIVEIEKMCKKICDNHEKFMKNYGLGDGKENKKRLTGKFETASFDTCKWAVGDRHASVRIQEMVKNKGKGFLEDRRPAGDCDPYRVCALLGELVS